MVDPAGKWQGIMHIWDLSCGMLVVGIQLAGKDLEAGQPHVAHSETPVLKHLQKGS